MDECIHDMDPDHCSICKHPSLRRKSTVEYGPVFTARFDGQCRGCNLPIHVGQAVVAGAPPNGLTVHYVHEGCR